MIEQKYAGFWVRVLASLIDTLIIMVIILPILIRIYGTDYWLSDTFVEGTWDVLLNYILPAIAIVIFWIYKSATPGKMATKIMIVDAKTGENPTKAQCIIRYLAYYVSIFCLFLGILWVAFDQRKQGWHDKIARTVVVYTANTSTLES